MPDCKNEIALPMHDKFNEDDLELCFGQNSCLDGTMEVMVYYPPDYTMQDFFSDEVDDRVGPQVVIVRTAAELYTLLDEVLAGDYTRFNVETKEEMNDD